MKKQNKKAVSLMLSYVILISIVIALSIGVFVWLKTVSNINPVTDCNEGTSVILESSVCNGVSINLTIKNNGRFNVSGVLVSVGNDTRKTPMIYLSAKNQISNPGFYSFIPELGPGAKTSAIFEKGTSDIKKIVIVQIQPFIIDKKKKVFCSESIIKQQIPECNIGS